MWIYRSIYLSVALVSENKVKTEVGGSVVVTFWWSSHWGRGMGVFRT